MKKNIVAILIIVIGVCFGKAGDFNPIAVISMLALIMFGMSLLLEKSDSNQY